jgi:hypothetical protein
VDRERELISKMGCQDPPAGDSDIETAGRLSQMAPVSKECSGQQPGDP